MATTAQDIYEKVTNQLVSRIEQGIDGTWHAPWHHDASQISTSIPTNADTGKPYRMGNIITLWLTAEIQGYSTGVWATYNQWKKLGAQVQKGQSATHCIFWKFPTKQQIKDAVAAGKKKPGPFARTFALFNAAQVDGWTPPEPVDTGTTPIDEAEAFFSLIGADVRFGGNQPLYASVGDYIKMPPITQYDEAEAYYVDLGHEHTHWTAHKSRLGRETPSYAFEELVAELGSAFISARLGLANEPRLDHAQYIKGWLDIMKADPKALFTASSQAQKAVDFLAQAAGLEVKPQEEDEEVSA